MAKITIHNSEPKGSLNGVQLFENGAPKKVLASGECVKTDTALGKIVTLAEVQLPKKP